MMLPETKAAFRQTSAGALQQPGKATDCCWPHWGGCSRHLGRVTEEEGKEIQLTWATDWVEIACGEGGSEVCAFVVSCTLGRYTLVALDLQRTAAQALKYTLVGNAPVSTLERIAAQMLKYDHVRGFEHWGGQQPTKRHGNALEFQTEHWVDISTDTEVW